MKRRFQWKMLSIVTGMLLILSGCFGGSAPVKKSSTGSLILKVSIPEQVQSEGVSATAIGAYDVKKIYYVLTSTLGEKTISDTIAISDEEAQINIPEINVGNWEIVVYGLDSLEYYVFKGMSSVIIRDGTTSTVDILMEVTSGELDVQVERPADLSFRSGQVALSTLTGELITKELNIGDVYLTASFTDLHPHSWPIEVKLYDGSEVVATGSGVVDILPGRTNPYTLGLGSGDGSLIIRIGWELPPATPLGLTGTVDGNSIAITWDANSETDLAGYAVYRKVNSSDQVILLSKELLLEPAYTDSAIIQGNTYTYWVQAYNTGGAGSWLSEAFIIETVE